MDFKPSPDELAWKAEVEAFIKAELPPAAEEAGEGGAEYQERAKFFTDKLATKGWLAPAWPKEYGGLALSYWKQTLYKEAMSYHGAPLGQTYMGVDLVGPTIIVYGTEEQKQEYLPAILKNEYWWAQGFSEPNSGSDLASLQTRAEVDGDDFVVNGGKIWTSGAQYAQRIFLLVRTDPTAPKHRGISFILSPIDAPGITVQPLADLSGRAPFNQVFLENVRVPRKNLVGELNRGWYVAATTLDFERSGIEYPSSARRLLEQAIKELKNHPSRPLDDDITRHKLAASAIEIEVSRLICYNITAIQAENRIPNYEASMGKMFGSEMGQRLARSLVDIYDAYGQLRSDSIRTRLNGLMTERYLVSLADTIYSGSSEIQRNVIATRGLGLPRL